MKKTAYITPQTLVFGFDKGQPLLAGSGNVTGIIDNETNIEDGGDSSNDPNKGQGGCAKPDWGWNISWND